jgi:GNAT superfamily N-acetyltransferase
MALSERELPRGVAQRTLQESDLDAALALSQETGWNQTAADWRLFLELGNGIGLVRDASRLIATAAILPHGDRFAWISMVLVTAPERRQGLASRLLRQCIGRLLERQLVPVLDATPAGRAVYAGLGFQDRWGLRRLFARAAKVPQAAPTPGGLAVRALAPADWPRVVAYDAAVFGADRGALLRRLAPRLPRAALVAERGGRIVGFLLGRDGRLMNQLGPLAAEDHEVAMALLAQAVADVPAPLAVDVPDRHAALGDWLVGLGFAVERPWTRMVYGGTEAFDDGTRLFAIAGPELG